MKNWIPVIIIVALAAAVGFWWLRSVPRESPSQLTPQRVEGVTLELVEKLKGITIDTSFFSDSQFLELESSEKPSLENLLKGRKNPFTPISRSRR